MANCFLPFLPFYRFTNRQILAGSLESGDGDAHRHWMQYVPARVEAVSAIVDWHKAELKLKLDKMLVYRPGAKIGSHFPEGGKLSVVGAIDLP